MAPSSYKNSMEDLPIPPGFTRLTSFTLKRVQRDISVAFPGQSVKHACSNSDKLRKLLDDKPWINYSEVYTISDSEEEDLPDERTTESLPNGVIRGCPHCEDCQKVIARWRPDGSCRPVLDEAPVFHPKEEEFNNPLKYIDSIRAIAEPYGICRIVPPSSWKPPPLLKEKKLWLWEGCKFSTRIQQIDKLQNRKTVINCLPRSTSARKKRRKTLSMQGNSSDSSETDASIQNLVDEQFGFQSGPDFTLQSFKKYADLFQKEYFQSEAGRQEFIPSVDDIEGEFWRIVEKPTEMIEVLYGADLDTASFGSGFPKAGTKSGNSEYVQSGWNLNNIPNLPLSVLRFERSDISGVKIPWLYVGMCLSSFCWHVEDHHLYSLNYMHMGSPKVWYGVPGKDAHKFEAVMKKHLPHLFEEQPDLLHNLVTQFSPSVLKREGVSVFRCVQNEGEFVLTFPRAYHSGFNCGFNCAEAVNIAPVDWLPHGQVAVELYRQQRHLTTISHDKLLIGAANEAVRALWNIYFRREKSITSDLEWKRLSGEDGILAKTFYVRKEAEQLQRKYLCPSQCRKMDAEFDASVRECVFCHHDLYLSAVGCSSCPNKYACLMHAKELCLCDWNSKYSLFRYNDDELDLLLDALKAKLSSVHKWALKYLGLSVQQYQVQKEETTPGNRSINRSEEMRDAALTGRSTQQQNKHSSGQISGCGENSGIRKNEAVLTGNDVGPIPSSMAQNSGEVATPFNRSTNASVERRDTTVADTTLQLQHGQSLSGQMSGCNESSWTRGTEAAPTRNGVAMHGEPSSSAMTQSDDMHAERHSLPRVVDVGQGSYTVEILEYGTIMPLELWSTRQAIFPKGFRSRVSYWSVLQPNSWCDYISQILDAGLLGPLFMVSVEGSSSEVFVHVSPKRCWDLVVQKVNVLNKDFYQTNKRRPGSIDGLELFGLSAPSVLQALEVLDTKRVTKFCRIKDQLTGKGTSGVVDSEVHQQNSLTRRTGSDAPAGNSFILQELFKKANSEELRALETVFTDDFLSSNGKQEVVSILSEEIRSRHR
ncbi:Transcription factor jumonji (jmj) family protein / zinc finger (C5HC2 type) family protein [Rhynchospora pubera]|uniref:Transcription factor jumonji (Jmj) family protein / zinc finger (C5HC2 type) family protein n=1 Tax=Rhynchospora pubera TaxID=906938 RepID=A0AAV8GAF2_9POAL|nr:Transcription factor jumonji (jmj) family protein / zinc finger (C5HC2 type) family protein [Rhynchospora pubera]